MKKILTILVLLGTTCLFSCEEVIQLDLKSAQEKYVVEANLSNLEGDAKVMLSKTKDLSAGNKFNGISGAKIEISDDLGNIIQLAESNKKGIYVHPSYKGKPGHQYYLRISIYGQVFTAQCKMPELVVMQDAYPLKMSLSNKPQWYSQVKYTDPAGHTNFYRFIEYRNDIAPSSVFVTNDELTDGKQVLQTIFSSGHSVNSKIKEGDQVRLEFQCISEEIYKFWFSTSIAKGNTDSAAPSNPVSTINGGAIGYFSAHCSQNKTFIVK